MEPVKLWRHQEAAIQWMMGRKYGILNYGMGTGKTLIAIMYAIRMKFKRVLIVTTTKGVDVWSKEYAWLQLQPPVDHNKYTVAIQAKELKGLAGSFVYVTSYARIWRPALLKAILDKKFDAVIFDESHNIAAHNSKTSLAAKKIAHNCQYRFCMTGTMLTNNPTNIYGQARAMQPDLFGADDTNLPLLNSFTRFREYFCYLHVLGPGVFIITGYKNMEEYNAKLGAFVLRADSDDVLDLPDAVHIYRRIRLPAEIQAHYKELKKEAATIIDGEELTVKNALVKSLRLHQLAGGSVPTDNKEPHWMHDEKINELIDIVQGIDEREPIVIFAKYTHEIQAIRAFLRAIKIEPSILSGSHNELEDWQQGKTRIIIVQTATGSESVDLSRASYTLFYSMEYSLSKYEQALRRTRRPRKDGTKPDRVFYYYLISAGTVDDAIIKALKDKSDVTKEVLRHMETVDNDYFDP